MNLQIRLIATEETPRPPSLRSGAGGRLYIGETFEDLFWAEGEVVDVGGDGFEKDGDFAFIIGVEGFGPGGGTFDKGSEDTPTFEHVTHEGIVFEIDER